MLKDYLQLHFIVLLWGFTAILGLLISIPALELVFYRTLLSVIGLAMLLFVRRQSIRIQPTTIVQLILTGSIVGLHWVLFFASARVANASICLAGMATCSLWTSVIEPFANRKAVKWYEVLSGLAIIMGLYVIFRFELNQITGLLLALGSAFLASVFTVINSRFTKKYHHHTITFYEMIGALLMALISLLVYQQFFNHSTPLQLVPQPTDWLWIAILAWICTVYAYAEAVELMKRLTAFAINLTVNLEPVYGIILAAVLFHEHQQLTSGFYLGTVIILLAVLSYPLLKRRDDAKNSFSHV
ncbi:MAG: DMT family transporter [Cytophagales bacterium]|nr:DMT family transporter [Bernardetiaceae bacterium]MDW8204827.1 DMT family transporter [Cytophagales bacterium]